MMQTDSLLRVREVVADALRLPKERVEDASSMENVSEWDSFGHLNILVALNKRFDGKAKGVPGLAKATSVKKIAALLQEHGVI